VCVRPTVIMVNIKNPFGLTIKKQLGLEVPVLSSASDDVVLDEDPLGRVQVKFDEHVRKLGPHIVAEGVGVSHIYLFLDHIVRLAVRRIPEVDDAFAESEGQQQAAEQHLHEIKFN